MEKLVSWNDWAWPSLSDELSFNTANGSISGWGNIWFKRSKINLTQYPPTCQTQIQQNTSSKI